MADVVGGKKRKPNESIEEETREFLYQWLIDKGVIENILHRGMNKYLLSVCSIKELEAYGIPKNVASDMYECFEYETLELYESSDGNEDNIAKAKKMKVNDIEKLTETPIEKEENLVAAALYVKQMKDVKTMKEAVTDKSYVYKAFMPLPENEKRAFMRAPIRKLGHVAHLEDAYGICSQQSIKFKNKTVRQNHKAFLVDKNQHSVVFFAIIIKKEEVSVIKKPNPDNGSDFYYKEWTFQNSPFLIPMESNLRYKNASHRYGYIQFQVDYTDVLKNIENPQFYMIGTEDYNTEYSHIALVCPSTIKTSFEKLEEGKISHVNLKDNAECFFHQVFPSYPGKPMGDKWEQLEIAFESDIVLEYKQVKMTFLQHEYNGICVPGIHGRNYPPCHNEEKKKTVMADAMGRFLAHFLLPQNRDSFPLSCFERKDQVDMANNLIKYFKSWSTSLNMPYEYAAIKFKRVDDLENEIAQLYTKLGHPLFK